MILIKMTETNAKNKPSQTNSLKNQALVLGLLNDEVVGDWQNALTRLHKDYSMVWVNHSLGELFRTLRRDGNFDKRMKRTYAIKGRNYDIKNITANDTCVMVELVESYPDQKMKGVFRTPLVLVLEFSEGKIIHGRHYYDPVLSGMSLSKEEIDRIYKK